MIIDRVKRFFFPTPNRWFFLRLGCVALVAYMFFGHVWRPMRIRGLSMLPAYHTGQVNLCNLWKYRFSPPVAGDVVMVRLTGDSVMYLKRVVAVGGQTVEFRKGVLWVDGNPVREDYVKGPCDWELAPREVRLGNVYVVGDNRSVDIEKHDFGQTSLNNIAGGPVW